MSVLDKLAKAKKVELTEAQWKKREESFEEQIKSHILRGLSESSEEWVDYEINHYRGCYHNCSYCYAKKMNQRFGWISNWMSPTPKEIRWSELKRSVEQAKPGWIFFCSACDPYQPIEEELRLSRRILEEVLLPSKHVTLILTKSSLVRRDYDIIANHGNVHVGFTIVSLDDSKNKTYEMNSSAPSERVSALKEAKEKDVSTFITIEPWIPGLTDPVEIINATKEFTDYYIIGSLQYYGKEEDKKNEYFSKIGKLCTYIKENNINYYFKDALLGYLKTNFSWRRVGEVW